MATAASPLPPSAAGPPKPIWGNAAPAEVFSRTAPTYAYRTGGAVQEVADQLIPRLPLPITSSSIIHDNAAGPGIITSAILNYLERTGASESVNPVIFATDIAPGMVEELRKTFPHDRYPDIHADIMDSGALTYPDNMFTHSIFSFAAFFVPTTGIREMVRTLKPGGLAAVTTWRLLGYVKIVQTVQKTIRPQTEKLWDTPVPEWRDKSKVETEMREAGLEAVVVEPVNGWFRSKNAEEATTMLRLTLDSIGVWAGWNDEEMGRISEVMVKVIEEVANDDNDEAVQRDGDTGVKIFMPAWVGWGRKPEELPKDS